METATLAALTAVTGLSIGSLFVRSSMNTQIAKSGKLIMKAGGVLSLAVFVTAMFALKIPQVAAQTCRWDGTAPLCNGSCGNNETEITRLDAIPDFWVPPFVNQNPPFGSSCVTGTKALCCSTPGRSRSCRWDGTAPFCDGGCRAGETQEQPPDGSSSGRSCLTGSKVYCCSGSTVTGTGRSPLEVASNGVIYAINQNNDLMWYRHDGRTDGSFRWAADAGKKVGVGWGGFKQIFSGGDGVIYALTNNGDLMWYRHDGRTDGSFRWAADAGKKVGVGWGGFKQIFSE
jgi:hypothetical protein